MKWKAERFYHEGDVKKVTKFAWIPVLSSDEHMWIWLETYVATYKYVHSEWFQTKVSGLYAT